MQEQIEIRYFQRILCVHIHDNFGESDEHLIPFDGNLEYNKVIEGFIISTVTDKFNNKIMVQSFMRKTYHPSRQSGLSSFRSMRIAFKFNFSFQMAPHVHSYSPLYSV